VRNLIKENPYIYTKGIKCRNSTVHNQNDFLHDNISYTIKRNQYKTVCTEKSFAKVSEINLSLLYDNKLNLT
jgi:hypothetical protein